MAKVEVKQIKSSIGCKQDQIATLKALGLKKIRDVVVHENTPQISDTKSNPPCGSTRNIIEGGVVNAFT